MPGDTVSRETIITVGERFSIRRLSDLDDPTAFLFHVKQDRVRTRGGSVQNGIA